jgi:hypothetical protein
MKLDVAVKSALIFSVAAAMLLTTSLVYFLTKSSTSISLNDLDGKRVGGEMYEPTKTKQPKSDTVLDDGTIIKGDGTLIMSDGTVVAP